MCITVSILWMKILRPEESEAMGPGLAIKVMAKHGLILQTLDPPMSAYNAWVSPVCKETLGQLSSYLGKERGLISLQGWVLLEQEELNPLSPVLPTGPNGHLTRASPSHPQ